MTDLERYWREFLAEHPEVRAMTRQQVSKVNSVWLDGAQGLLLALRDACKDGAPDLERIMTAMESAGDEIKAGILRCRGEVN